MASAPATTHVQTVFAKALEDHEATCTAASLAMLSKLGLAIPATYRPPSSDLFPAELDVSITQRDIDRGNRRDSHGCPAARAIRRRFDGAAVVVGAGSVVIYSTSREHRYYSNDLARFVGRFDGHGPSGVEPLTIHLTRFQ